MPHKLPPAATGARHDLNRRELALQSATAAIQAGRLDEAERLAAGVLEGNAGNLAAMQLLGTALLMQGRGQEALVPLERAARQSHNAATETWLAMALRQVGREEEARKRLYRAIKRRPPFPPA